MEKALLIAETRRRLRGDIALPYQASVIGMNLFLLMHVLNCGTEVEVRDLLTAFRSRISAAGLEDLAARQMTYALRLAEAGGSLLYEELHKLLSLCDEIYALESLGFSVDQKLRVRFDMAVRTRLHSEGQRARLAAQDKVTDWNRRWWWYAELLDS